jgi:hypothetical protein
LLVIWDSAVECLEGCATGVKDLEDRGWRTISFWLNSADVHRTDPRPFHWNLPVRKILSLSVSFIM